MTTMSWSGGVLRAMRVPTIPGPAGASLGDQTGSLPARRRQAVTPAPIPPAASSTSAMISPTGAPPPVEPGVAAIPGAGDEPDGEACASGWLALLEAADPVDVAAALVDVLAT